ncbi:prokaryotic E2 ligase family D protein [Mucilaginibacter sp. BJC16-A38]|uniref:prokaryotic E2 ligase family D protein n=1 Tax=Mucilaginibacter phenanthrenivorans TaxID=1234842 RepID=UPI002157112B|nr:prokaryotic E2 ligase family D protein [Mucilaginibacter phenanthrenivorans]MCR8556478.1 prokaryotic E2 ligase family D protein [Mucilaginibacter phenanthrenivorans]
MSALNELLQATQELKGGYLKSRGILPSKVLYVNYGTNGYALWYTPPKETNLFFVDSLNIPSGKAKVPAMVWKASADKLMVYAVKGKTKPNGQTVLHHAPYLNIYNNGNVCMGTVKIDIGRNACLEDFMSQWENYFYNSYFSHSINGGSSTKTDTKELWRTLMETGKDFPLDELRKNGLTLKQLII